MVHDRQVKSCQPNVKHEIDADTSKSYNATYGSVAQTVEQRTHKPLVTGSNPVAATNKHRPSVTALLPEIQST